MTLETQVVSLDLAKRLKELGFKQESLFCFERGLNKNNLLENYCLRYGKTNGISGDAYISAYTVAELGEMLLNRYNMRYFYANASPEMKWATITDNLHGEYGKTMADSMAKMLIYLKENNLI